MTKMKKIAACALALMMLASTAISVYAATEHWNDASTVSTSQDWVKWKNDWESIKNDYEKIALTPGKDESELNFAWLSKTSIEPAVRISMNKDMTGATEFKGTQTATEVAETNLSYGYYANKVTVSNLAEETTYYYQVNKNGQWQDVVEFTTGDKDDFSFLYVGDPQIGACKGQVSSENETMSREIAARNDAFNWAETLKNATTAHPEASFMVSAGDQVNTSTYEYEYAGFLNPKELMSLPIAAAIGNHDSGSIQYSYHFNNPNTFSSDQIEYTEGKTKAGSDYYYTYGDALFIMIDTNNYNCATHENVIKKAIEENPDCTWKILTFHQDIYGSGHDHSASDGIILRTQLTPIIDRYDIDVVLQGHDHTYSRTYQLSGDGKTHTAYDKSNYRGDENFLSENNCYVIDSTETGTLVDPEGTVYFEANSSTGSKFYELISAQQDYIAERNQTWTPSYAVIDITETTFTFNVYDAQTNEVLGKNLDKDSASEQTASTFTIVKKADFSSLEEMIQTAKEALNGDENYTEETVNALNDAIAEAEEVLNNETSTTNDISNVISKLADAKAALMLVIDNSNSENDSTNSTDNESSNESTSDSALDSEVSSSSDSNSDSDNVPTTGLVSGIAPITAILSLAGLGGLVACEKKKRSVK